MNTPGKSLVESGNPDTPRAKMDLAGMEEAAKSAALKQVALMLQRPDQLQKVDAYKKRTERKKAALEAMLKTGVQSQLEGVKKGLAQLQAAALDVQTIGENLTEISELVTGFEELQKTLKTLSREQKRQSQLATAREHLKQIFNVQEIMERTSGLIEQDKLLLAHKNLMELESARDALMLEVHKSNVQSEYDNNLLKSYFREVEKLGVELWRKCRGILTRTLDSVRGSDPGPQSVVTVLRIVEREQRIDAHCLEQEKVHGFLPVGRPRNWKDEVFKILNQTVKTRIEGNQLEDRSQNKQWLARYLETCRQVVVGDLRSVKGGAIPCFPPHYGIYNRYVESYHLALSDRLKEIAEDDLEKNELFQLLTWLKTYTSDEMLGNPQLKIKVDALPLLLPTATIRKLGDRFLKQISSDLREWLDRTLSQEKDDWYKDELPELDSSSHYYTTLPSILIQMVDDQVELGRKINADMIPRVIAVATEEMIHFARRYKDAFEAFKMKKFEDRDRFRNFTSIMVSIANNCGIFLENMDSLKTQVRLSMEADKPETNTQRQDLLRNLDKLKEDWQTNQHTAIACLLDEVYEDLNKHWVKILTKQWLESEGQEGVGIVCATVEDYQEDHGHLKPHLYSYLLMELQYRVMHQFIRAIETRRLVLSNPEERKAASRALGRNGEQLRALFLQLVPQDEDGVSEFALLTDVFAPIAEVFGLGDKSLLSLELSGFLRKYPDAGAELISGLAQMRGDIGRSESRTTAQEILEHNKYRPAESSPFTRLFKPSEKDLATQSSGSMTRGLAGPTQALLANVMGMAQQLPAKEAPNPFDEPHPPPRRRSTSKNPFDE